MEEHHNITSAFVQQPQSPTERKGSNDAQLYSGAKQREDVFITHIRATNLVPGLRCVPAGYYVAVQINGKTTKTSDRPKLVGKDVVEWDDEIILPSERSYAIYFKVYAFFELETRRGNGVLLRRFKTTVDVLDRGEELQPIRFLDRKVLSLCSSLRIITKRRIHNENASTTKLDLPISDAVGRLEQLTNTGYHALQGYRQRKKQRDLEEAITCFERVQAMCPPDHPNHSVLLLDLATTKFVQCQDNGYYHDLDVAIALYRDALQPRTSNQPGYSMTAIDLCITLLARLQRQRNETDREGTMDSPSRVVKSYAYRAAWLALLMAGISIPIKMIKSEVSQAERANPEDEELIRRGRAMLLALPDGDFRRLGILGGLGDLMHRRLDGDGNDAALVDIHETILVLEQAVKLLPNGNPDKPAFLNNLGDCLFLRFRRLGELADINKSISMGEEAVRLAPSGYSNKPALLNNLGSSLMNRFERLSDIADVDKSILMFEEAVDLTPNRHPDKPSRLGNLGKSLSRHFERVRDIAKLSKSISMFEEAVRLAPDHPEKPDWLSKLGSSLCCRFEHLSDLVDINKSILTFEEVVDLTPDSHPSKPARLNNLGTSLFRRFQHLDNLADLDQSISVGKEAVRLVLNGGPDKPAFLSNLGSMLAHRFQRLGDLADLDKSMLMKEEVVCLTPNGHPDHPARLSDIGSLLLDRFRRLGDLADLDKSILIYERAVRLTPVGHPDKPGWLNNLGSSLLTRFDHLGDLADLEKSILVGKEAEDLIPSGDPNESAWLISLANSLSYRFQRLGDLADINKSISTFEQVIRLTPSGHRAKPVLLNNLGSSLFHRFQRLGDLADLDKSILMTTEALRLVPDDHPNKPARLINLGNSLMSRFKILGNIADVDKSILMNEEAVRLTPNDHPDKPKYLNNLGFSLSRRFAFLGDLADIDKSILTLEEAVCLTPNGHPGKPTSLNNLAFSLRCRSVRLGDAADIDRSILMHEEAVVLTPDDHPDKPCWLNDLGSSLLRRFERLDNLADIEKSVSMGKEAVRLTPNDHPAKPVWLNGLGISLSRRFESVGDFEDLRKSISVLEEAVHLTPNGHPDRASWLNNLGGAFMTHFERSHNPSDLHVAMLHFSTASCSSTGPTSIRFLAVRRWISSAHLEGKIQAALDRYTNLLTRHASTGPTSTRFHATRQWTSSTRLEGNSLALLDAYTTAIALLPQLAWVGLPLPERHRVLLEAADLARDAAAAALDVSRPETAVEWLEQGRSVVWNQLLQLRTPVDVLRVEHPLLAHHFQHVSQQLEHTSSRDNNSAADTQPLEEEVRRHHGLALEREKLLVEIRSLPGFDRFLLPKTSKQLAALANSGPVVYLNASEQRYDALIVDAKLGTAIALPLPGISHLVVENLQNLLRLTLRRNGFIISRDDISALIRSEEDPVSRQFLDLLLAEDRMEGVDRGARVKPQRIAGYAPDDLFQRILAYLWNEVANPVRRALGLLTPSSASEKMARIFWCPTGPLVFLPIHAAGLYNTTEAGTKLSDFAISSYVPTLNAFTSLPEKDPSRPSSKIRLITIPQPPTDGQSGLASVKDEIDHIRTLSAKSPFVVLQESQGTVEDVMEKLTNTDWAHFACHGVQDPENPLDSGLCLANGRRLKLSDVIRLSRPQGGLAFLSACQTAQGDERLSEESVHLAAGMLLAGYGGVVATMWSINDADAPKVTKGVYEHLFQDGKVPDTTEAAEALHYAVKHLRDSGASFTSWVPFIHVGR